MIIKNTQKIKLPINTKLYLKNNYLFIKGIKGILALNFKNFNSKYLTLKEKLLLKSLFSRLIKNKLLGVSLKFIVRLTFVGVGYRVESVENNILKLKLGYSHYIYLPIPFYINIFFSKKTSLIIESLDNQLLKEFCNKLQNFKYPDSYKGKGILYKNQKIYLKEGKKK